jgi:hypothetical protein
MMSVSAAGTRKPFLTLRMAALSAEARGPCSQLSEAPAFFDEARNIRALQQVAEGKRAREGLQLIAARIRKIATLSTLAKGTSQTAGPKTEENRNEGK